eukprot:470093-Prymnesium_polylepis.1
MPGPARRAVDIKVLRVDVSREAVRVVAVGDGGAAALHATRHALVEVHARRDPDLRTQHQLDLKRARRRLLAEPQLDARVVDHGRAAGELLVVDLQREPLDRRALPDCVRVAEAPRRVKVEADRHLLARARPRVHDGAAVAQVGVGARLAEWRVRRPAEHDHVVHDVHVHDRQHLEERLGVRRRVEGPVAGELHAGAHLRRRVLDHDVELGERARAVVRRRAARRAHRRSDGGLEHGARRSYARPRTMRPPYH